MLPRLGFGVGWGDGARKRGQRCLIALDDT